MTDGSTIIEFSFTDTLTINNVQLVGSTIIEFSFTDTLDIDVEWS